MQKHVEIIKLETILNITLKRTSKKVVSNTPNSYVITLGHVTHLNLSNNELTNVNYIWSFTDLLELYLHKNKLNDIEGIASLINLKVLHLYYNELTDIHPLKRLIRLEDLRIGSNKLMNISILNEMSCLKILYLPDNNLTDITVLGNLKSLKKLCLSNNRISDIAPLQTLDNLVELHLGNNKLADISALRTLSQLQILFLRSNRIMNISPLASLKKLKTLSLASNRLTKIEELKKLSSLTRLILTRNEITDIKPLIKLCNLKELLLSYNQISDISPVRNLNLTTLYIDHNPLIPSLHLNVGENHWLKISKMKRIFISYSLYDEEYKNDFILHSVTMRENKLIEEPFACNMIALGAKWDSSIKEALRKCDIMVCLISKYFLNSNYIRRIEVMRAIKQGKKIVPIIVRPCDWENSDLGKYQGALQGQWVSVNKESKTISEYSENEKDACWTRIMKQIRGHILNGSL